MKNVTTQFSPTGNGSLNYPGNLKYKNVKLVLPSDADYQAYLQAYISASKSKHPSGYVPQPPSALSKASRIAELIVRNWYGSQTNRIIQYDVFYKGTYQRHYKECDIIRIESDGSLTIGEIKSSHSPSAWKALSQLQHSCEILSTITPNLNPVAIIVNMASINTSSLYHTEITEHQAESGFFFNGISLSLGDITEYARTHALTVDFDLLVKANLEAIACVEKKAEKQQSKIHHSLQQEFPCTTISVFGMVLQNALGSRNRNY